MTRRAFMIRHHLVTPFVDTAANGDIAAISDAAPCGDDAIW